MGPRLIDHLSIRHTYVIDTISLTILKRGHTCISYTNTSDGVMSKLVKSCIRGKGYYHEHTIKLYLPLLHYTFQFHLQSNVAFTFKLNTCVLQILMTLLALDRTSFTNWGSKRLCKVNWSLLSFSFCIPEIFHNFEVTACYLLQSKVIFVYM